MQALVLFVLVWGPVKDFVLVSFPRCFHRFELEWLEGEVAMYSVRWVQHRSIRALYPNYERATDFVPHLYPPTHQILAGEVHDWLLKPLARTFGGDDKALFLAAGRIVSILATFGIMAGLFFLVREATRSVIGGSVGAMSYLMFYKPSGYWYDLNRVDSLGMALGILSAWLLVRRKSGYLGLGMGIILGCFATFTKQTAFFLPLIALGFRLVLGGLTLLQRKLNLKGFRPFPRGVSGLVRPEAIPILMPLFLFLLVNLWYFYSRGAFGELGFYLYEVPSKHPIFMDTLRHGGYQQYWQFVMFPLLIPTLGILAKGFVGFSGHMKLRWLIVALSVISAILAERFLGACRGIQAPTVPKQVPFTTLAYVLSSAPTLVRLELSILTGGFVCVALRWLFMRKPMEGICWIPVFGISLAISLVSWPKIGGYINNFIPSFVILSLCMGLGTAWMLNASRRARPWLAVLAPLVLLGIIHLSWEGTRRWAIYLHPPEMVVARLESTLDKEARIRRPAYAFQSVATMDRDTASNLPGWIADGLRYHVPAQVVALGSTRLPDNSTTVVLKTWKEGRAKGLSLWDCLRFLLTGEAFEVVEPPHVYGGQRPDLGALALDARWGAEFLTKVRELHANGGVYLPQNNFLAFVAGIPTGISADAVRDVQYAGFMLNERLRQDLKQRRAKHLIFLHDMVWMDPELRDTIKAGYGPLTPLIPDLPSLAIRPVTGAVVRPDKFATRLDDTDIASEGQMQEDESVPEETPLPEEESVIPEVQGAEFRAPQF